MLKRFRSALARIRHDWRAPLPGADRMTRRQRFTARFRFLLKNHGWKLVWGFIIFYLIRDVILYIIIPYLIARQVFA
ncbi:MAG: hypothetical protein HY851_00110 [candidate division Zixibacteria bacterium]|nr:hypothetical protein [candidate division Zixibacteria bacterium]